MPNITFSFGVPLIVGNKYTVPVLATSDTAGTELFGINLRFAYESAKFSPNLVVKNFQGGFGLPQGQPLTFTGNDASKAILGFASAPRFVNGVVQLSPNATRVLLQSIPRHLFDVEFTVNPGADTTCPSFAWDKLKDPANGGFLGGSEGITATEALAYVEGNYITGPTTEYGIHKNWEYIGSKTKGQFPYGRSVACK